MTLVTLPRSVHLLHYQQHSVPMTMSRPMPRYSQHQHAHPHYPHHSAPSSYNSPSSSSLKAFKTYSPRKVPSTSPSSISLCSLASATSSAASSPCAITRSSSTSSRHLRRGKWTPAEEEYAAAVIQYFLEGVLGIQYGTTLRGYLAQLLQCDPMRVSKKLVPGSLFAGVRIDPKIGRRAYYPCASDAPNLRNRHQLANEHLAKLRTAFCASVEQEEAQERRTSAFALEQAIRVGVGHKRARFESSQSHSYSFSASQDQNRAQDHEHNQAASLLLATAAQFQPQPAFLPSLTDVLKSQRTTSASPSPRRQQQWMSVPVESEPMPSTTPYPTSSCLPPLRVSLIRAASTSSFEH